MSTDDDSNLNLNLTYWFNVLRAGSFWCGLLNMPGLCGAGGSETQEQPVPQRLGILRDNQWMKSKFDKMISDQCLFLQHMLSASILN